MAVQKLSQIALAGSAPALTDTIIGVTAGTTDNQFTLTQIKSVVGGSSTLAGLSDVLISGATDGQVLCFNGPASKWENDQRVIGSNAAGGSGLAGKNVLVKSGAGDGNGAGGTINVYGGDGHGSGYGGNIITRAGAGTAAAARGGYTSAYGGNGYGNGSGGGLYIGGGKGGTNGAGGILEIRSGPGYGAGAGGPIRIYTGTGASGGPLLFQGGQGNTTYGGNLSFNGGIGTTTGGTIGFRAGQGGTVGGNLLLEAGGGTTSGGQTIIASGSGLGPGAPGGLLWLYGGLGYATGNGNGGPVHIYGGIGYGSGNGGNLVIGPGPGGGGGGVNGNLLITNLRTTDPSVSNAIWSDNGILVKSGITGQIAFLNVADQTVSGGANVTSDSLTTGNITVDCGARPLQFITNGGAFTITAPASDGSCMLLVTNNASAGTITFSGFSVGTNKGDALDTTNTHKFTISIWRINSISGYRVAAHQ